MRRSRALVDVIALAGLLVSLTSCCLNRVNLQEFRSSSLTEQIAQYERAVRANCVGHERNRLLSAMSLHGQESADAMAAIFIAPRRDFPLDHAILVFEFSRFSGASLVGHPGTALLRKLALNSTDLDVKEAALRALTEIEK